MFDFVLYIQTIDKYNQIKKQKILSLHSATNGGSLITEWRIREKRKKTRETTEDKKTRDRALAHKKKYKGKLIQFLIMKS